MAGKVQVAKFSSLRDINDNNYGGSTFLEHPPGKWNMEEDEVLDRLSDASSKNRAEILEQLAITVRRNGGRLPYADRLPIFEGLAIAMSPESNWDVRHKCIQLLNEIIPHFGDDLDDCMKVVLPNLIPNIGDKVSVRRAVIQNLHLYMKYTKDVPGLLHAITQLGLESDDAKVRRETINAIPLIFTREFARENFFEVTQSLAKKLLETSAEDNLRESSIMTLKKIEDLVGEAEFDSYMQRLAAGLRRYYMQVTGRQDENGYQDTPRPGYNAYGDGSVLGMRRIEDRADSPDRNSVYQDNYEFGIIPSHVMSHINDHDNFRTRAQGVEELKGIMRDLSNAKTASDLLPHMVPYISFLNNLLDDSNFKITTVTLEILSLLVEKVGKNISHYLRPLVNLLTKRMGDNKIVIRTAVMRVVVKMMQSYSPQPVLDTLAENLHHKNSRMRQETLNFIIAGLLRFPSYEFGLPDICNYVAPLLIDPKRHVRHAAMDCVAVLAQAMGAGRLHPLVTAVDQVELNLDGEGLMSAVQARLARRQLPKLNSDNLVEYAFPIPSSATQRSGGSGAISGADIDWIMAVGSGSGSARTARGSEVDYESLNSSARSTPAVPDTPTPAPRRFMSAGRGRNKLPWEEERDERIKAYDTLPGSAPVQGFEDVPPKPKTMWASDTESSPEPRRVPRRRITVVGINQVDDPPDTGSYTQMYQQKKFRKQQGITSRSSSFGAGESDVKENGFTKSDLKTPRSFLEPISVDPSASPSEDVRPDEDEASTFPRKATLARGSATRRHSPKVPPISSSDKFNTPREDDSDTASLSLEGDNRSEMADSLRRIRNSASKKKAEKIFEKIEKQGSRGSMDSYLLDSSISSSSSRDDSKKKGTKQDFPFEAKPKLVRTGSLKKREFGDPEDSKTSVVSDFSPMSGVTFRNKPTSDVQIVGKGYSDESAAAESKPFINSKARGRRPPKGALLSPLGVASTNSHGAVEMDDDRLPGQDNIALVGKGMFDTTPALATDYPVQGGGDRLERRPFRPEARNLQQGVIGIKVKNNPDSADALHGEDEADEDFGSKAMAKTLRDRIAQKQEEAESKRIEKERRQQEEKERQRKEKERQQQENEEKLRKERERQQERLKRLSTNENLGVETLAISGSNSTAAPAPNPVITAPPPPAKATPPKPPPPAITPRKKIKAVNEPVSSHPMSAGSHSPTEENSESIEDLQPFKDPDLAHRDALKKISTDEWESKIEAMNIIRRLALHHPATMTGPQLHPVVIALINEVKNLRSAVSRVAITTLGDLYQHLKKNMEPDLDMTTKILLAKSGESNGFIRGDVDTALGYMVDNVTPQRALLALISGGATHKNHLVRRTAAAFLVDVVEKMGPGRILSGIKDITDRVLPTAAQFALDGAQENRYYGKKILSMLMSHQDFDKMLTKYLPANTLRNIQDVVENLKVKGLGELPSETSSAKSRRSGHGSRASSSIRSSSANRYSSEASNATPTTRRRTVKRTDDATMEEIKSIMSQMSDSDWRVRCKGIDAFQEMCEMTPDVVATNIIKIFDKFLPRLQDSNSKVNVHALNTMYQVTPILKEHMGGVINMALANIAPNLSSKNTEIFNAASEILNLFMDTLDPYMLIQPFAHQAAMASTRSKAFLVEKVTDLTDRVYPRKQKPVVLHVLPLLWQLLGTTNPSSGAGGPHGSSTDLKTATAELARTLHSHLGQTLLDRANTAESGMTTRQLQLLQDIINSGA